MCKTLIQWYHLFKICLLFLNFNTLQNALRKELDDVKAKLVEANNKNVENEKAFAELQELAFSPLPFSVLSPWKISHLVKKFSEEKITVMWKGFSFSSLCIGKITEIDPKDLEIGPKKLGEGGIGVVYLGKFYYNYSAQIKREMDLLRPKAKN